MTVKLINFHYLADIDSYGPWFIVVKIKETSEAIYLGEFSEYIEQKQG